MGARRERTARPSSGFARPVRAGRADARRSTASKPPCRERGTPNPSRASAAMRRRTTRICSRPSGASPRQRRRDRAPTPPPPQAATKPPGKIYSENPRVARTVRKTRPAAIGAGGLDQKTSRRACQALLVLRLRKSVLDRAHGVEIREIELREILSVFRLVENMTFLRGPFENDSPLPRRSARRRERRSSRPSQRTPAS